MPCFGATLRIHAVFRGGELVKNVESHQLCRYFALEKRAGARGVPHKVIGIHHLAVVASA